jgi:hypothetical protein
MIKSFSSSISLKMAEQSEAKSAKQSFASKSSLNLFLAIFSEIEDDNDLVTL